MTLAELEKHLREAKKIGSFELLADAVDVYIADARQLRKSATRRQLELVESWEKYCAENGCNPTLQEAAKMLGISKPSVYSMIEALIEKGLMRKDSRAARGVYLVR
jgi:hypothetical protein